MGSGSTERLDVFEPWSPSAFVAGGLLLIVGFLIVAVLDLPGFVSLVLVGAGFPLVVGLGGIYSQVDTEAPRLALAGGAATAAAALAFIVDVAVTIGTALAGMPGATPLPDGAWPPLVVAFLALGVGLFLAGVGGLRSGVTTRPVGLLLVGAGLSFPPAVVAHNLFWELPAWLLVTAFMAFTVAVVLAGILLDAERVLADGRVPPRPAAAADEATASGWTNEHVRDEYDVDGAESRTGPIRMVTLLQVHRMGYELAGPVWGSRARSLDSVRRALGRVLNREAAVEQTIAEREYVFTTIRATDRKGVGSPYWRLGVAALVGVGLASCGTGLAIGAGVWAIMGPGIGPEASWGAAGVLGAGGLVTLASVRRTLRQLADQA